MSLPMVAIVGRPNVGKSSLFNVLARRRKSIVEATPGVTRDRVAAVCDVDDTYFEVVDTGGHGLVDRDDLEEHVERQIQYAMDQAALILFVVDAREGLSPLDHSTAELLRKSNRADRVRLIANKVDTEAQEAQMGEFARLGFGQPQAVSALHGYGRTELRELIVGAVGDLSDEVPTDPVMKIALVGKRNAGKSTFVNSLVGEDRVIVSEIPGTTRDSVDVLLEKDGRSIMLIDTAGVRKKRMMKEDLEYYAYVRATQAVRRADVVLMLIDGTEPVGQVDKRLGNLISGEYKPCILVVNKWDLVKGRAGSEVYGEYLTKVLPGMSFAPIAFTAAVNNRNTYAALDLAAELFKQSRTRVGTGQLNQAFREIISAHRPRSRHGKKPGRLFYATQVSIQPPTIVVFANNPDLVDQTYERYLVNQFRELLPFSEIPIRLSLRARRSSSRAS